MLRYRLKFSPQISLDARIFLRIVLYINQVLRGRECHTSPQTICVFVYSARNFIWQQAVSSFGARKMLQKSILLTKYWAVNDKAGFLPQMQKISKLVETHSIMFVRGSICKIWPEFLFKTLSASVRKQQC